MVKKHAAASMKKSSKPAVFEQDSESSDAGSLNLDSGSELGSDLEGSNDGVDDEEGDEEEDDEDEDEEEEEEEDDDDDDDEEDDDEEDEDEDDEDEDDNEEEEAGAQPAKK